MVLKIYFHHKQIRKRNVESVYNINKYIHIYTLIYRKRDKIIDGGSKQSDTRVYFKMSRTPVSETTPQYIRTVPIVMGEDY